MKRNSKQHPRAVVREIDGELVLDDPDAVMLVKTLAKIECETALKLNAERVEHFKRRVSERGMTPEQVVIVLINVDDVNGAVIAKALMPNVDWQEFRDRGEIPFARGLAGREGILEAIEFFDKEASEKLRQMSDLAVVVIDHQVAEIFVA